MPAKKTTVEEPKNEKLHQNMRFYGQVQDTPKEAQKSFNNGRFSGTDINPMWRIKKLTEVFGPAGFGWWTQNVSYSFEESPETKEIAVFCELELVVKDPETGEESHPIYGVGGNTFVAARSRGLQSSDEAMKMAYTDALSIACKALGFSHDIYYQADRTKYTAADISGEAKPEAKTENKPAEHTADTATVIAEIDQLLAVVGKNMDRDQKLAFAKETIAPIIGSMNYKTCTEIDKLVALRDKLKAA